MGANLTHNGAERARLVLGFGIFWSLTKGYMNSQVFSFPDRSGGEGSLFLLYLIVSSLFAVGLLVFGVRRGARLLVPAWIPALCACAGLLLLSGSTLSLSAVGCLLCSVGMTGLFVLWFRALSASLRGNVLVNVALGFLAGNVFAWGYEFVEGPIVYAVFVVLLFVDALLCVSPDNTGGQEEEDGRLVLGHALKLPAMALVSFATISIISIAMSYIALFERQVPIGAQIWIHLIGPTLGSALALLLVRTFKSRINGSQVVIFLMATLILFVPILQSSYVTIFKLLSMAAVEFLFVQAVALCAYEAQRHGVVSVPLGAVCWGVLSLSTGVGAVLGRICSQLSLDEALFYGCLAMVFAYLIIIALVFAVVAPARKRRSEAKPNESTETIVSVPAITPPSIDDIVGSLVQSHGLTPREQDVLKLLAVGRSGTYIAETLCISPDTVKGHTRRIYAKLDVHSKQELLDLFQFNK
ncbi:helix-turn-helix transcriptional regulator [Adlercreutzia equolifaciens]|uniref:response regulator transcription factor n=1 Tax=Adlercreutzia equolifaciens TaxID=446660 RepID=UPI0023B0AA94|nr:helix-turn-helix transcriptional regulator [Adlercreutzia equolifaciens]MDE8702818.1 helix-turn-helix transcriptional regulator [Adlercreutzia equolifaciens]